MGAELRRHRRTELVEAVSEIPGKGAYLVRRSAPGEHPAQTGIDPGQVDAAVIEERIEPRLLS